jgi:hypothetical protein
LKEPRKELPLIDAVFEFYEPHTDEAVDYAAKILDTCLRFYTLDQISALTGISRRLVSYFRHRGFNTYSNQLTMEILAGTKVLVAR